MASTNPRPPQVVSEIALLSFILSTGLLAYALVRQLICFLLSNILIGIAVASSQAGKETFPTTYCLVSVCCILRHDVGIELSGTAELRPDPLECALGKHSPTS